MTEKSQAEKPIFESQKERWLKYGANVGLATIVVILLAAAIVYLAQKTNRRLDTTASGSYSLKPQTLNILKDINGRIKLVSLYRREVKDEKTQKMTKNADLDPVVDLLDEYKRHSDKIDVEVIDPVENNAKVETLINGILKNPTYGGEVDKY